MRILKEINFEGIIKTFIYLTLLLFLFSCTKTERKLVEAPFNAKAITFIKSILKLDLDSLSKNGLIKDLKGEYYYFSNEDFHYNYYKWCTFKSGIDTLTLKFGRTPTDSLGISFLHESFLKSIPEDLKNEMKIEIENIDNRYIFRYMSPYRAASDVYTLHILMYNKSLNKYFYAEKSGEFVDVPNFGIKTDKFDLDDILFNPQKTKFHLKENIYFPKTGHVNYAIFESTDKIDFKYKSDNYTIVTDTISKKEFLSWFFKVDSTLFDKQFTSKSQMDSIQFVFWPQTGDYDKRFNSSWLFEEKTSGLFYYGHCYYYDSSGNRKNHLIYNILERK